jgi:hypothetical protein
MSDFDPIKWSTRLDGHGLAPAVEPDQYAQWGGHGMEAVKINCVRSLFAPICNRWKCHAPYAPDRTLMDSGPAVGRNLRNETVSCDQKTHPGTCAVTDPTSHVGIER